MSRQRESFPKESGAGHVCDVKNKMVQITKDTPLAEIKKLGEACKRCGKCCSYGSGFILEKELPRIAEHLNTTVEKLKEDLETTDIFNTKLYKFMSLREPGKPYGPCVHLKDDKCSIHKVKPLHCAIGNCSKFGDDLHTWFIVNNCLNPFDPESIRQYNMYVGTGGRVIPGAGIVDLFRDKKKLRDILEYRIMK